MKCQEIDAIQADINALDSWVEQVVTNGNPDDLFNLFAMAERLEEKTFAMKKGHAKHSAEIVEEKKAQIMESKDDVYICNECGENGDPKVCYYCFEDKCVGCGTDCKACEQKWA
eukprot:3820728-Ditylum_brightwellii.AAC.1